MKILPAENGHQHGILPGSFGLQCPRLMVKDQRGWLVGIKQQFARLKMGIVCHSQFRSRCMICRGLCGCNVNRWMYGLRLSEAAQGIVTQLSLDKGRKQCEMGLARLALSTWKWNTRIPRSDLKASRQSGSFLLEGLSTQVWLSCARSSAIAASPSLLLAPSSICRM